MNTTQRILTTSALLSGLLAAPAFGTLILEDYLNFPAANNGNNLGTLAGWNQNTGNVQFTSNTNLSFSNSAYDSTDNASTGAISVTGGFTGTRASNTVVSPTNLSGQFWFSALHQRNDVSGYSLINFGNGNDINLNTAGYAQSTSLGMVRDGATVKAFIVNGQNGNNTNVITWNTNRVLSTGTLNVNQTYLMLAHGDVATSTLRLWFFAENAVIPTTADFTALNNAAAAHVMSTSALIDSVQRVAVGHGGLAATSGVFFDALRMSNLSGQDGFEAVLAIPEPGTLALVGIAFGAALLSLRRRK